MREPLRHTPGRTYMATLSPSDPDAAAAVGRAVRLSGWEISSAPLGLPTPIVWDQQAITRGERVMEGTSILLICKLSPRFKLKKRLSDCFLKKRVILVKIK